jgi:hypothetical protein
MNRRIIRLFNKGDIKMNIVKLNPKEQSLHKKYFEREHGYPLFLLPIFESDDREIVFATKKEAREYTDWLIKIKEFDSLAVGQEILRSLPPISYEYYLSDDERTILIWNKVPFECEIDYKIRFPLFSKEIAPYCCKIYFRSPKIRDAFKCWLQKEIEKTNTSSWRRQSLEDGKPRLSFNMWPRILYLLKNLPEDPVWGHIQIQDLTTDYKPYDPSGEWLYIVSSDEAKIGIIEGANDPSGEWLYIVSSDEAKIGIIEGANEEKEKFFSKETSTKERRKMLSNCSVVHQIKMIDLLGQPYREKYLDYETHSEILNYFLTDENLNIRLTMLRKLNDDGSWGRAMYESDDRIRVEAHKRVATIEQIIKEITRLRKDNLFSLSDELQNCLLYKYNVKYKKKEYKRLISVLRGILLAVVIGAGIFLGYLLSNLFQHFAS